mgnify:CR=1 FL=1
MANIKTLSEAASYLANELINEIDNHAHFSNPEVSELASIITEVFSNFEKEVNGYTDSEESF